MRYVKHHSHLTLTINILSTVVLFLGAFYMCVYISYTLFILCISFFVNDYAFYYGLSAHYLFWILFYFKKCGEMMYYVLTEFN